MRRALARPSVLTLPSPSFNHNALDEPTPALSAAEYLMPPSLFGLPDSPADADFDSYHAEATTASTRNDNSLFVTPATPRRPRKHSKAVARSLMKALRMERIPSADFELEEQDKVQFDTATLERIIPYVQELRDRVRGVIRDAEDPLPSQKSLRGTIGPHGS